jgi:parallel beta-helix repeat protein
MKVTTTRVLLVSILLLFAVSFLSFNGDLNKDIQEQLGLRLSTERTYNLTGSVIILDDDPEEIYKTAANVLVDELLLGYTWDDWVLVYDWCTGSGTLQDPYVIQQVYIDGQFFGKTPYFYYSCIIIRNSEAYFVIRDCTMIRAGNNKFNAGIRLENVSNGIIIYNECHYNNKGVMLLNSDGNAVGLNKMISDFNCTIDYQNSTYGMGPAVYVYNSHNNTIEFNNITNYVEGLDVWRSNYNKLRNNMIISDKYGNVSSYAGIILTISNYTEITENDLIGISGLHAIDQDETCVGNVIEDNYISQSLHTSSEPTGKIKLDESNYNTITKNRFFSTYEEYLEYIKGNNSGEFPFLLVISVCGVCGVAIIAVAIVFVMKRK